MVDNNSEENKADLSSNNDKTLNFINNYYTENQNNIVKEVFLFIPCLIGRLFLGLVWLVPFYDKNNIKEKIEHKQTCFAGFKFFLLFHLYFIFIYLFIQIGMLYTNLYKVIYYYFSALIFSACLNIILIALIRYIAYKTNMNRIKKSLTENEKILFNITPLGIADIFLMFIISCIFGTGTVQIFAGVHKIPILQTISSVLLLYMVLPKLFIVYTTTSVITNKRVIIEKFVKSLNPIFLTFEKIYEIEKKKYSGTDFMSINFSRENINLEDIVSIETRSNAGVENTSLVLKNGVILSFKTDDEYIIQNELKKIISAKDNVEPK